MHSRQRGTGNAMSAGDKTAGKGGVYGRSRAQALRDGSGWCVSLSREGRIGSGGAGMQEQSRRIDTRQRHAQPGQAVCLSEPAVIWPAQRVVALLHIPPSRRIFKIIDQHADTNAVRQTSCYLQEAKVAYTGLQLPCMGATGQSVAGSRQYRLLSKR